MINVHDFLFNSYKERTYIVYDDRNNAMIIDPGCSNDDEENMLDDFIETNQLNVKFIVNTHCHVDHILGNYHIKNKYCIPIYIHEKEKVILDAAPLYYPLYGFNHYDHVSNVNFIDNGISLGDYIFEVYFTPGHSPGHISLVNKENNICFSGDTLFKNHIGRTDLPYSNHDDIIKSLKKLLTLDDNVIVYPGHGKLTTIGDERINLHL